MPKVKELPKWLKPFSFHGVEFKSVELDGAGENLAADCLLCGREGKFFVNSLSGLWDCKRCAKAGNPLQFLREVWETGTSNERELEVLARDRKLARFDTLNDWSVRKSPVSGEWMLAGYGPEGALNTIYRYSSDYKTKKKLLYATPEMGHHLHGVPLYDKKCETVYICEGPWDGMALWEALRTTKDVDGNHVSTSNVAQSLAAKASVIAVPGCNVWKPGWSVLLTGKRVVICFDSDHPLERDGKTTPPAGWLGARRLAGEIAGGAEPPASIHVLQWGPDGYDLDRKHGYDLRDLLTSSPKRSDGVGEILSKIVPIPEDWLLGRSKDAASKGEIHIEVLSCTKWPTLVNQWRKAMNWSEGLDRALSVMLSSVLSTQMIGDQLWCRVISPPSTGKTQLCDGIGTARKHVRSVGNFTGLHSGFQTDASAEEDHSLLSQIKGMTMVVKDGDTLLKSPNRERIMSQIRDAYDMNCAVAYGNRVKREYVNHRFTFVLAGTEAMMEMDASDLGARFLDCVVMNEIDPEMEADINQRGFYRILNNRGASANGVASTQDDPEIVKAKAMTGGYVEYLRTHSDTILSSFAVDNAQEVQAKIDAMAQFVAYARARPSKTQLEAVTREMSARLNSQLTKLACCMTGVLGRKSIDREVLRRVRQVAVDTARGRTLTIMRCLAPAEREGMEQQEVATLTHIPLNPAVITLLRFMRTIGATEWYQPKLVGKLGRAGRPRWRLTERVAAIFDEVEGR